MRVVLICLRGLELGDAKKKASRFEDSIAKYLPDVLEEMQGIAEGCGRRIF